MRTSQRPHLSFVMCVHTDLCSYARVCKVFACILCWGDQNFLWHISHASVQLCLLHSHHIAAGTLQVCIASDVCGCGLCRPGCVRSVVCCTSRHNRPGPGLQVAPCFMFCDMLSLHLRMSLLRMLSLQVFGFKCLASSVYNLGSSKVYSLVTWQLPVFGWNECVTEDDMAKMVVLDVVGHQKPQPLYISQRNLAAKQPASAECLRN